MKREYPPVWLGVALLALAIMWRMLGAPVSGAEWADVKTPLWQARVLLPSRVGRILTLWLPGQTDQGTDSLLEGEDPDGRQLVRQSMEDQPRVRVFLDAVVEMPLESYVCGVVAAEMPASYHEEALRAQAVAARTRALWQMENGGCKSHPEADICGDSGCCQGYASMTECREKWGDETELYRQRILNAAASTMDEHLTYEGQIITVMYHAMSGGKTEDVQAVFSEALPYLVSVESGGEESARGFYTDSFFAFEDMADRLNREIPGLNTTAEELRRGFSVAGYTDSGRVANVQVGERVISASRLRQALDLRSTWFSISSDGEGITFHQRGYGHGVGMSQVGANSMAAKGADYRDILQHYYPGTEVAGRE